MEGSMQYKEDECPLCKSELYLNPTMKFIPAICGHKFCETCINRTFLTSSIIQCPICKTSLRRGNFLTKVDEDPELERELNVRRTILKEFNKRREDFKTLREYNDYLEEVEDLIYNLVNDIDIVATQDKIKKYRRENQAVIVLNQSKKADEDRLLQEQMKVEQEEYETRKRNYILEEQKRMQDLLKEKEDILDDWASGRTKKYTKTTADLKKASSRNRTSEPMNISISQPVETKPAKPSSYSYAPQPQQTPSIQLPVPQPSQQPPQIAQFVFPQPTKEFVPSSFHEDADLKLKQQAAIAGGWKEEYITKRAIEEAFNTLFITIPIG